MLNIRPLLLLPLALYSLSCATDDPATTTSTNTTTVTTTVSSTTTTSETATTGTTTSQTETGTTTGTATATTTETGATTKTTTTTDLAPCADLKTGTGEGFCGEDFTLLNSAKESISLYDFAGDVILLDLSGFTWGVCQGLAPAFQEFYSENQDKGFTAIVSLKTITSYADLDTWADTFGATHTLLGDIDLVVWNQYKDGDNKPQYIVFDREMNIVYRGRGAQGHDEAEAAVLTLLAE
jgi:peroxiredoxin